MHINFDISGDKQVSREILRVGEHAKDARPAFKAIMSDMIFWETEQFESEGKTGSGGWDVLKEDYVQWKLNHDLDPRILHASLALEKALTAPGRPKGSIRRMTRTSMEFGTSIHYAGVHQNPQQGQTQRRPIEFTGGQRGSMMKTIQHWVLRGIAA
jgi:hypothetical protein